MKKTIIVIFAIAQIVSAQSKYFVQADIGKVYPRKSDNGYSLGLTLNRQINDLFAVFASLDYGWWNKYTVSYQLELTETNKNGIFSLYSSDDHKMLSLNLGSKLFFRNSHNLKGYLFAELSGSGFSYNSYHHIPIYNKVDNKIIGYSLDQSFKKKEQKFLFGISAGLGTIYYLYTNFGIQLEGKVSSNFNNDDINFFGAHGMYWSFSIGGVLNI